MAALRSRLSLLTGMGGAPSVTTRAGFSTSSREPSASALGDLTVTVRAFPPGQSPRTFHSSRSSCSVRLPGDSAVPSHGVPSVSFGAPIEDQTNNTAALAKKAQQRLYFLRKLRRTRAPASIMCTFYRGTIESILTSCITVWYGACTTSYRKTLQRIVRAAENIVGVSLPSLQDIYSTRLTRKALCIAGDPTHPTHSFFSLLPSGRRLRSLQARTSRLKDSFIHQAVRKLNSLPSPPPPLLSFTPCPPAPHIPRTFHSPPLTNCDPHQSLCAALDWSLPHPALTANYLFLTVWLKTVLWALITLTDW